MKRTLFILLASALLSGCNTVNLAYRNADWYLENRINEYATFHDQQKEAIRQDVSAYISWHRQKLLPDYIKFLQALNRAAQSGESMKADEATQLRTQLRDLYRATMQPMIAPAAKILAGMDSGQILELEKHFAAGNQQMKQEMLGSSRDEYLEIRSKRTLSFLHWLAGNFSSTQEQKIIAISRSLPATGKIYLQQRETHQHRLIAMLQAHASETDIAAYLTAWLFTPDAILAPEQRNAMRASTLAWDRMIVQIHDLLTPQQKAHLNELVTGYIQEMTEANRLAAQNTSK